MRMLIFTKERVIEFEVPNRKELINVAIPCARQLIKDGDAYAAEIVYNNGWREII